MRQVQGRCGSYTLLIPPPPSICLLLSPLSLLACIRVARPCCLHTETHTHTSIRRDRDFPVSVWAISSRRESIFSLSLHDIYIDGPVVTILRPFPSPQMSNPSEKPQLGQEGQTKPMRRVPTNQPTNQRGGADDLGGRRSMPLEISYIGTCRRVGQD